MQDYARHAPTSTEPWWEGVTPADRTRYDRASRLSRFAREIARGPTTMMRRPRLVYRQQCVARWRAYLDGWTPERKRAP